MNKVKKRQELRGKYFLETKNYWNESIKSYIVWLEDNINELQSQLTASQSVEVVDGDGC
jgi:hypothetical protein